MTNHNLKLKNPILTFLLVFLFFTTCNGQIKSKPINKTIVEEQSFTSKNKKLTKPQGTAEQQNVHCSLQDKNGNLWFGTTGEGVYRYDGKEFTQFTEKDGLSNNSIWSILEDKVGTIWFGTDEGVCRYDGKTISKISFTLSPQSRFNAVWSMMQDKSGIIWFGTSEDLYCYDGKSFSRFLDMNNISNQQNLKLKWIQCILQDSNGTIWMGSGPFAMEGVIQFDGNSITSSKPNGDGWIRYIIEDKNKKIWFGGRSKGNFIYDRKTFTNYTEKVRIGNPMLVDKSGNVWFTGEEKIATVESEGGIWCYDGKSFKNYNVNDGMSKYFVYSMLEDRNGNIWFGTRNCKLYRYDGQNFIAFSE